MQNCGIYASVRLLEAKVEWLEIRGLDFLNYSVYPYKYPFMNKMTFVCVEIE